MTAWYRALATRPLPPDPATTAEQIAADNVVESSTFALLANPVNMDAIGSRSASQLIAFTDWLAANQVRGFIGETGWDRTTDSAAWNEIGDQFYALCDAAELPVTYWAAGETWSSGYKLLPYGKTGSTVDTTYAPSTVIEAHPPQPAYMRGVVSAPGGFWDTVNGSQTNIGTYSYDSAAAFAYYASRGHNLVRIPFMWERIQPVLGAALDATALALLTTAVNAAGAAGLKVILDCHNYGTYALTGPVQARIGSSSLTIAHFTNLWTRLSTEFKTNTAVYGYGLMNEPKVDIGATYTQHAVINEFPTTIENWATTSSGAWSALHGGSVVYVPATGNTQVQEADSTLRDRSANGNAFWADVWVDSGAVGNWDVILQSQDAAWGYIRPGAAWVRLIKGQVNRLYMPCTQSVAAAMRNLQILVGGSGRNGTDSIYIMGVYQGDMITPVASTVWENASQAVVTAIRANADTKATIVAGFMVDQTQTWGVVHPFPWITDSASNTRYEHHQYFDNGSGLYASNYATNLAAAKALGWDTAKYLPRGPRGLVGPKGVTGDRGATGPSGTAAATVAGVANPADYGFSSWSFDAASATSGGSPAAAGIIRGIRIQDTPGAVLNNLCVYVSTPGATLTNTFMGLYDSTGARIAVSADISTTMQTSGQKTIPMLASCTVPTNGVVIVAFLTGSAVTPWQVSISAAGAIVYNFGAPSPRAARSFTSGSAQTALPSTITLSGVTVSNSLVWVATAP